MAKYARERPATVDNSPAEIRGIFSENLKKLILRRETITEVCSNLGIHRSQFSRYLNGSAFPKPDVLHKICNYFGTDARILLEPVESFQDISDGRSSSKSIRLHPEISDFLQIRDTKNDTSIMPCGFYRFVRGSFISPDKLQSGVLYVYEADGRKFVKGFMAPAIARELNIPIYRSAEREYRGAIIGTDVGIAQIAAHRNSTSFSFTYLELNSIVEKTFLVGYCARTMSGSFQTRSVVPAIYEKLPNDFGLICDFVRKSGYIDKSDLPKFYQNALEVSI